MRADGRAQVQALLLHLRCEWWKRGEGRVTGEGSCNDGRGG